MAHDVGFQGLMTSSKCKQICINIPTSCPSTKNPTSKT